MAKYARWSWKETSALLSSIESIADVEKSHLGPGTRFCMTKQYYPIVAAKLGDAGFEQRLPEQIKTRWQMMQGYFKNVALARKFGVQVEWEYFDRIKDLLGGDGLEDSGVEEPVWMEGVRRLGQFMVPGKPFETSGRHPPAHRIGAPLQKERQADRESDGIGTSPRIHVIRNIARTPPTRSFDSFASAPQTRSSSAKPANNATPGKPGQVLYHLRWEGGHSSMLMSTLNEQRLEKRLCDLTLHCGEVEIAAHAAVMAAGSRFFAKVLDKSRRPSDVAIAGASANNLLAAVEFIYTGETRVPFAQIDRFLALAERLRITGLDVDRVRDACQAASFGRPAQLAHGALHASLDRQYANSSTSPNGSSLLKRSIPTDNLNASGKKLSKYDYLIQDLKSRSTDHQRRLERVMGNATTFSAEEPNRRKCSPVGASAESKRVKQITVLNEDVDDDEDDLKSSDDGGSTSQGAEDGEEIRSEKVESGDDGSNDKSDGTATGEATVGEPQIVIVEQDWSEVVLEQRDASHSSEPETEQKRVGGESECLVEFWRD